MAVSQANQRAALSNIGAADANSLNRESPLSAISNSAENIATNNKEKKSKDGSKPSLWRRIWNRLRGERQGTEPTLVSFAMVDREATSTSTRVRAPKSTNNSLRIYSSEHRSLELVCFLQTAKKPAATDENIRVLKTKVFRFENEICRLTLLAEQAQEQSCNYRERGEQYALSASNQIHFLNRARELALRAESYRAQAQQIQHAADGIANMLLEMQNPTRINPLFHSPPTSSLSQTLVPDFLQDADLNQRPQVLFASKAQVAKGATVAPTTELIPAANPFYDDIKQDFFLPEDIIAQNALEKEIQANIDRARAQLQLMMEKQQNLKQDAELAEVMVKSFKKRKMRKSDRRIAEQERVQAELKLATHRLEIEKTKNTLQDLMEKLSALKQIKES